MRCPQHHVNLCLRFLEWSQSTLTSSYGALKATAHSGQHCLKPLPCSHGARAVNANQFCLLSQSLHDAIELTIVCLGWFFVIVGLRRCSICKCHFAFAVVMALVGPWTTNSFFVHLCIHMHVHMYVYVCMCAHIYIYIYIYICIRICSYICHGCGLTLCMRSCKRMLLYVRGGSWWASIVNALTNDDLYWVNRFGQSHVHLTARKELVLFVTHVLELCFEDFVAFQLRSFELHLELEHSERSPRVWELLHLYPTRFKSLPLSLAGAPEHTHAYIYIYIYIYI